MTTPDSPLIELPPRDSPPLLTRKLKAAGLLIVAGLIAGLVLVAAAFITAQNANMRVQEANARGVTQSRLAAQQVVDYLAALDRFRAQQVCMLIRHDSLVEGLRGAPPADERQVYAADNCAALLIVPLIPIPTPPPFLQEQLPASPSARASSMGPLSVPTPVGTPRVVVPTPVPPAPRPTPSPPVPTRSTAPPTSAPTSPPLIPVPGVTIGPGGVCIVGPVQLCASGVPL